MPKKRKKKSAPKRRRLSPLEAAMAWAFKADRSKKGPRFPNLEALLKEARKKTGDVIRVFPRSIRRRFKAEDRRIIREAFRKRRYRNASIHARLVLEFIARLIDKAGQPPPPWISGPQGPTIPQRR